MSVNLWTLGPPKWWPFNWWPAVTPYEPTDIEEAILTITSSTLTAGITSRLDGVAFASRVFTLEASCATIGLEVESKVDAVALSSAVDEIEIVSGAVEVVI